VTPGPAVVAEGVGKRYRRWGRTRAFGTLKSALLGRGFSEALSPSETVEALWDVSFSVEPGETFGVIGANGSGKSTLLKLVAGIFKPTTGRLRVNGKVSALIELGAGFHPEISGRENVVINGVMLGLTRKAIERKLPEIVAFAGLEDFIDQPVKTYSSGMYVRLGFAVAVHVDPDILVVDEVLAVGDEAFSRRCLDTIGEFRARGKTIFFVSHALGLVEEICHRVLYLSHGRLKGVGEARAMLAAYRLDVAAEEGERLRTEHEKVQKILLRTPSPSAALHERAVRQADSARFLEGEERDAQKAVGGALGRPLALSPFEEKMSILEPGRQPESGERPRRWGNRDAEITACRLLDASGSERYSFRSGEEVVVEIEATPSRPLVDFVFGVGVFTPEDVCVYGSNTEVDGLVLERFDAPATVRLTLPRCDLGAGSYLLDVAVHSRRGTPFDYWRGACRFQVESTSRDSGVWRPERVWGFTEGIRVSRP
jgi:ABC-type polysaccharide/polyol phosphate transport system ATPase subunit